VLALEAEVKSLKDERDHYKKQHLLEQGNSERHKEMAEKIEQESKQQQS
jgi:hypothetical protein